jgi:hypothetical protein
MFCASALLGRLICDVSAQDGVTVPKKLSEIAKKMAMTVLGNKNASPDAISIALQITHIAWNYADEDYKDEPGYIYGIQDINKLILPVKKEFVIQDVEQLIERLMEYKRKHFPNDKRTIFSCKHEKGNVKVTWR